MIRDLLQRCAQILPGAEVRALRLDVVELTAERDYFRDLGITFAKRNRALTAQLQGAEGSK